MHILEALCNDPKDIPKFDFVFSFIFRIGLTSCIIIPCIFDNKIILTKSYFGFANYPNNISTFFLIVKITKKVCRFVKITWSILAPGRLRLLSDFGSADSKCGSFIFEQKVRFWLSLIYSLHVRQDRQGRAGPDCDCRAAAGQSLSIWPRFGWVTCGTEMENDKVAVERHRTTVFM
jgi:hypothetical protein